MNAILPLFAHSDPYVNDYGTYSLNTTTQNDPAVTAGALITMILAVAISYILTSLALGQIFKKAGVESWKAWVPFYNYWNLLELGGQKGYWAVLLIVPFVSIVSLIFIYIAMYNIGLKFGKGSAFVVLGILFPLIWMIWLAVDKSTWRGQKAATKKSESSHS